MFYTRRRVAQSPIFKKKSVFDFYTPSSFECAVSFISQFSLNCFVSLVTMYLLKCVLLDHGRATPRIFRFLFVVKSRRKDFLYIISEQLMSEAVVCEALSIRIHETWAAMKAMKAVEAVFCE